MTRASDIFGQGHRPQPAGAVRRTGALHDPLGPVVRSVLGIISESAGLVRHVAALGIVLVIDTDRPTSPRPRVAKPPPRPAADATNIIRFPMPRNTKPRK